MKYPIDETPYERDPQTQRIHLNIPDGTYVYVQDTRLEIHVLPDGPHRHPKILGNCQPAIYAGDLTVFDGKIRDVTNLSGTFQFSDAEGLLNVVQALESIGFAVLPGAVRLFHFDRVKRPDILR